jgi:hypothetical protein
MKRVAVMVTMLAMAFAAPVLTQDKPASVIGKWNMDVDTPHGKMSLTVDLKADPKDAKKILGTLLSDQLGTMTLTGEVADGKLRFDVSGGPGEMSFVGKLKDADTMNGILSAHNGDMTAVLTRVKPK